MKRKAHLTNEHKKPWVKAGMSRRTWYRYQARKLDRKKLREIRDLLLPGYYT